MAHLRVVLEGTRLLVHIVDEIAEMIAEVGLVANAGKQCLEMALEALEAVAGDFFFEVSLVEGLGEGNGWRRHGRLEKQV